MPIYPLPTSGLVGADIGPHPGASDTHLEQHYQINGKLNALHLDVRADFGGGGLGIADETAAIEAAYAAGEASGRPFIVYCGPGRWNVSQYENPDHAGIWSAIQFRDGSTFRGAGESATEIFLIANQGDHVASHIMSNRDQAGTNKNIRFEGFTLNGNAANQDYLFYGIVTTRTRGVTYRNVTAKNCRGTANAPPGETFHIENSFCSNVVHEACTVTSDDAGPTGTGFSCDVSTNVTYTGCFSELMEHGHGYTHWHCANITYTGCFAQRNGDLGFNSEFSHDITYTGCHGGGAANDEQASYPYTLSQDLGNGNTGFVANFTTHYSLIGCSAIGNGGNGFSAVNQGTDYPDGQIIGGHYTDNAGHGLYFGPADEVAPRFSISPATIFTGNGYSLNVGSAIGSINVDHLLPGPPVPASGVAYANPYPFDVEVIISTAGVINFVTIAGANLTAHYNHVPVRRGGTIAINYSSTPPTWIWFRK